jgi:pimeloyl-ACP methyl ester carboxylesterase
MVMQKVIWRIIVAAWMAIGFPLLTCAQADSAMKYGFRLIRLPYKGDTVEILLKSKKGEEKKRKPLLFFCQGSLPQPLIITYADKGKRGIYGVFGFNPDSLAEYYHLAIVSKPGVPLIAASENLTPDLTYTDPTGHYPAVYILKNLLDYYVKRDQAVIDYLRQLPWIATDHLIVAGHSEGATIAAKLAAETSTVTALIYSGGNPMGRVMTVIERDRMREKDSASLAEADFQQWEKVVADPTNPASGSGDSYATTYPFSLPPLDYLEKLTIPVLVTYGTKDADCPFNDYFRAKMILQRKRNFTFKAYIGVEHNFFPVRPDGSINYDVFNWDKVAEDWRKWLGSF